MKNVFFHWESDKNRSRILGSKFPARFEQKTEKSTTFWPVTGRSKKGTDMKLGCLIALTIIAHNIFKNQPDRIKLWPTEFWENTTLSPKNRFFGPNTFSRILAICTPCWGDSTPKDGLSSIYGYKQENSLKNAF